MKNRILFIAISIVAVLGMVTLASANSVTWDYATSAAIAGKGPGGDGLMGTGDDSTDAVNVDGSYSVAVIEWEPGNSDCDSWPTAAYMTGTQVRCMESGGFTTTYMHATQTPTLPGSGPATITLDPSKTSTGDNCGVGEYSSTSYVLLKSGAMPPMPKTSVADGKVFAAGTAVTEAFSCGDGPIITYPASYLEGIRNNLPAGATYFSVACGQVTFGVVGLPCLNNSTATNTTVLWTDDPIQCDGVCCDNDGDGFEGTQCTGGDDCLDTNPAVHPGATEICGNGLDDDCQGGDEACPGPCAGGAAN